MREVECRLSVVASGEQLAAAVKPLPAGTWLTVTGFLSRAGYRAPDLGDLVIAYEPVWAIGTGKTATPGQASGRSASPARTAFSST